MPVSRNKPPPQPPKVEFLAPPPPERASIVFEGPPVRRILTQEDQALFTSSPTHNLILSFIKDLNASVYNLPNSHSIEPLPLLIQNLSKILDGVHELVDLNPAVDAGGSRFGNKGFQAFYDAVWEKADEFHQNLGFPPEGVEEVKRYFCESWGNRTRIDYGSGHELNFLAWLLCFYQYSFLRTSDYPAVVLHLFLKYVHLMRHIQTTYYLEPAGSHGVWGLDDYQFLPFLFGSAQLFSHMHLRPKSIHDEDVLEEFKDEYMYLGSIAFINSIKTTAGLRWHSPMLDDISSALNWGKINGGMLKMYEKEVLGKLPIMQHFMFGALMPAADGMSKQDEGEGGIETEEIVSGNGDRKTIVIDREGMRHVHSNWGECCGIKVPSAIGAREQVGKQQLRKVPRIPFD